MSGRGFVSLAGLLLATGLIMSCNAGGPRSTAPTDGADAHSYDVSDLGFLSGRWLGEAFGGIAEETWNPPLGGQMLGTFRLVKDGAPEFSEHMLITEIDGRILLRLKHFGPDLVGWEKKGEFLDFALETVEGATARFGGVTFERSGDRLRIALQMESDDGPREEIMEFTRVR